MNPFSQCTPQQVANYTEAYNMTLGGLIDAQTALESAAETARNANDYAKEEEAQSDADVIAAKVSSLKQQWIAWRFQGLAINPPDDATVKKTTDLATDLANAIARQIEAEAVLNAAVKLYQAFAAL